MSISTVVRPEEITCPICREILDFPMQIVVDTYENNRIKQVCKQHVFCKECIQKRIKESNTCPVCKYKIISLKESSKTAEKVKKYVEEVIGMSYITFIKERLLAKPSVEKVEKLFIVGEIDLAVEMASRLPGSLKLSRAFFSAFKIVYAKDPIKAQKILKNWEVFYPKGE